MAAGSCCCQAADDKQPAIPVLRHLHGSSWCGRSQRRTARLVGCSCRSMGRPAGRSSALPPSPPSRSAPRASPATPASCTCTARLPGTMAQVSPHPSCRARESAATRWAAFSAAGSPACTITRSWWRNSSSGTARPCCSALRSTGAPQHCHAAGQRALRWGADARPSFYSHKSAPGVVMAVGNTGLPRRPAAQPRQTLSITPQRTLSHTSGTGRVGDVHLCMSTTPVLAIAARSA